MLGADQVARLAEGGHLRLPELETGRGKLRDHPLKTRQQLRREQREDEEYELRELTRIREREARDRHPLESWGLSEASVAELTSVSDLGERTSYLADETELQIETDWDRMVQDGDSNEEFFARYEVPLVD